MQAGYAEVEERKFIMKTTNPEHCILHKSRFRRESIYNENAKTLNTLILHKSRLRKGSINNENDKTRNTGFCISQDSGKKVFIMKT